MSKRPLHRSILREIRTALSWDQRTLSERIGVSLGTVKRLETGSLQMTSRIALRVFWATGVSYQDVLANKPGVPQTRFGPLDKNHLARLDERARRVTDKERDTIRDDHAYEIELLLKACLLKAPRKLWALDAAIMTALKALAIEFELVDALEQVRASAFDPKLVKELNQKFRGAIEQMAKERSAKKPKRQPV
jgi:transcriptional regulator with XRE-family HTH domain